MSISSDNINHDNLRLNTFNDKLFCLNCHNEIVFIINLGVYKLSKCVPK